MTDFVLVHGSWHGGWCWDRVSACLRDRGHRVCCPTLTGMGDRRHLAAAYRGHETYVEDICTSVDEAGFSSAVLVGHSFAGAILPAVAKALAGRVSRIVYLDAHFVGRNLSIFDAASDGAEWRSAWSINAIQGPSGPEILPPDPSAFGIIAAEDQAWVASRLTPIPLASYDEKIIVEQADVQLPGGYILCDKGVPRFDRHAERAGAAGLRVHILDAPHDAMVTHPIAFVEILLRISGESTSPVLTAG